MRAGSKSHLYRHEVTEAAIKGLVETIAKVESHTFLPEPLNYQKEEVKGRLHAPMKTTSRCRRIARKYCSGCGGIFLAPIGAINWRASTLCTKDLFLILLRRSQVPSEQDERQKYASL